VKDKKWRLEYRARHEAADKNTTINHGCWQGEAGQQAARRRRRAARRRRRVARQRQGAAGRQAARQNGECGEQMGVIPTIHRWRRGGRGRCEHPRQIWTDADKAGLVALRNAPIEMADTSYGRFLATQKRDAERAYQHIDAEEREAFLRKLMEIDADDAKDGQSPPSNPTPS
jgi:hypothetical protein